VIERERVDRSVTGHSLYSIYIIMGSRSFLSTVGRALTISQKSFISFFGNSRGLLALPAPQPRRL